MESLSKPSPDPPKQSKTGTRAEYKALKDFKPTPKVSRNMTAIAQYKDLLKSQPQERKRIKDLVAQSWWNNFWRSVRKDEVWENFFDKYMFDKHGVLDAKSAGLRGVIRALLVMYVHIRAKFGEPVMEDWEITWQMNEDVGPIIQAENKKLGKAFGMAPPITGFYDHKSELRKLRSDRDAGEIYEVPENLKAFVVDENTPSIKAAAKLSPALRPATDASVPGSSPSALDLSATTADHVALSTQAITSNTGAFASLSGPSLEKRAHKREKFGETDIIEASGIDDEDWGLMFHGDTELYGDEDDDVMDYEEAKECARGNEGYVYKREDAKQAKRKGWLW